MLSKLHIQTKGQKAGSWVSCHALYKCRNGGLHIQKSALDNAQAWFKHIGKEKELSDFTEKDILIFLKLHPDGTFEAPNNTENFNHIILPDSSLLANNRVRRGFNDAEKGSDLLKQLDVEGAAFHASLSEDEKMSIRTYCGHSYGNINAYNRAGREGVKHYLETNYDQAFSPLLEETIDTYVGYAERDIGHLDRIFDRYKRPNSNNRVLHRVVNIPKEERTNYDAKTYVDAKYKIGDTITEPSYMSTTADSDYVLSFGGHEPQNVIVYEILTNKGIPIHDPSTFKGSVEQAEREVLLNRGSKFKIVNITEANYKSTYPEGKPTGHSAYHYAIPQHRYTVIQMVEEE